jgi:hypothetical protein
MCEMLWLDPSQFQVLGKLKRINENEVVIELRSISKNGICPRCKSVSASRYKQFLVDLSRVGFAVCIGLYARRFFFENPACPQKIFCARLGDLVARWGRRTIRLAKAHLAIGLALGGAAGH